MNVSLTPELEQLVTDKVASGLYHTASEVVREGLRLIKERDEMRQIRLDELRNELQVGIDELDRGEGEPLDMNEIRLEARRLLAERKRGAGK